MCKKAQSLPASPSIEYPFTLLNRAQDVATAMQCLLNNNVSTMALLTLPLYFDSKSNSHASEPQQIQQSIAYYLEPLCRLVRKTDQVLVHETTLYFLLSGTGLQGATIVRERLWEALLWRVHNAPERNILCPKAIAIGYSAYPQTSPDLHTCILAAREKRVLFEVQAEQLETVQSEDLSLQARQLGVPYLSPLPHKLPAALLQLILPSLAHELHCYPLGRGRNTLTVAMTNPRDNQILSRLQQETGLQIFPVITSAQELKTALEQFI